MHYSDICSCVNGTTLFRSTQRVWEQHAPSGRMSIRLVAEMQLCRASAHYYLVENDQYYECCYDPNPNEAEGLWIFLPGDQASYLHFLFLLSEI
jgi:hypothetical protein